MADAKVENVRVIARARPFNKKEAAEGATMILDINETTEVIKISDPTGKQQPKTFTFDQSYSESSNSEKIYTEAVKDLASSVLSGKNACMFTYGQTGAGKSYSMTGTKEDPGIITRIMINIFDIISESKAGVEYQIDGLYYEVYNEKIRDLLNKGQELTLVFNPKKDEKGQIINPSETYPEFAKKTPAQVRKFQCADDLLKMMDDGNKNRVVAATSMNATSSRSHAIVELNICKIQDNVPFNGKLYMVDLAGSERQDKTGATGQQAIEGNNINLSLSTLGKVIEALADGQPRSTVPYRDSKLTGCLSNALGGNSITVMMICLSPASTNYEETVSTLRYGDRAKKITNKVEVNMDPKDAIILQKQDKIKELEAKLEEAKKGGVGQKPSQGGSNGVMTENMTVEEMDQMKAQMAQWEQEIADAKSSGLTADKVQKDIDLAAQAMRKAQQELADKQIANKKLQQQIEMEREVAAKVGTKADTEQAKRATLQKQLDVARAKRADLLDQLRSNGNEAELHMDLARKQAALKLKQFALNKVLGPEKMDSILNVAKFDIEEDCWSIPSGN